MALAARMIRCAVGGIRSHPLVSFSGLRWFETTGRSASTVYIRVATLAKTPVIPMWSYGAVLGGMGRLTSVQQRNQTRVRLSA